MLSYTPFYNIRLRPTEESHGSAGAATSKMIVTALSAIYIITAAATSQNTSAGLCASSFLTKDLVYSSTSTGITQTMSTWHSCARWITLDPNVAAKRWMTSTVYLHEPLKDRLIDRPDDTLAGISGHCISFALPLMVFFLFAYSCVTRPVTHNIILAAAFYLIFLLSFFKSNHSILLKTIRT